MGSGRACVSGDRLSPSSRDVSRLTPVEAVEASYARGVTDEFVEPMSFYERGVVDGDAVLFFNFRPDRARELTRSMTDAPSSLASGERSFPVSTSRA